MNKIRIKAELISKITEVVGELTPEKVELVKEILDTQIAYANLQSKNLFS